MPKNVIEFLQNLEFSGGRYELMKGIEKLEVLHLYYMAIMPWYALSIIDGYVFCKI